MFPSHALFRASLARAALRRQYSSAPPSPPPKPMSSHISIYKDFGRPFAKVFLMAVFTYQALYWAWLKMEKDAEKRSKQAEITKLEGELAKLRATEAK